MKAQVEALARLPGVWRGGELEQAVREVAPTGHGVLDRELPGGGWPLGALSEVLHDGVGIGEVHFLCGALAHASRGGGLIAWIGAAHLPYAPALAAAGIELERCMVVEPAHREDALWAAEQSLRSGACAAVLLWLAKPLPGAARSDDYAWLRRLQLAAQAGRAMAVLYRCTAAERLSTPAHLRVVVSAERGALALRIPKRRGPPLLEPVRLELARRARRASLPEQHPQPASQPPLVPADLPRPLPRIAA